MFLLSGSDLWQGVISRREEKKMLGEAVEKKKRRKGSLFVITLHCNRALNLMPTLRRCWILWFVSERSGNLKEQPIIKPIEYSKPLRKRRLETLDGVCVCVCVCVFVWFMRRLIEDWKKCRRRMFHIQPQCWKNAPRNTFIVMPRSFTCSFIFNSLISYSTVLVYFLFKHLVKQLAFVAALHSHLYTYSTVWNMKCCCHDNQCMLTAWFIAFVLLMHNLYTLRCTPPA